MIKFMISIIYIGHCVRKTLIQLSPIICVLLLLSECTADDFAESSISQNAEATEPLIRITVGNKTVDSIGGIAELYTTAKWGPSKGVLARLAYDYGRLDLEQSLNPQGDIDLQLLVNWIRIRRMIDSQSLDLSAGKTRFVQELSRLTNVQVPNAIRELIISHPNIDRWQKHFNDTQRTKTRVVRIANGKLRLDNGDTWPIQNDISKMVQDEILFSTVKVNAQAIISVSQINSTDVRSFGKILALNEEGRVAWSHSCVAWSDRVFDQGTMTAIVTSIDETKNDLVVLIVFPNSFGVECLDLSDGSMTWSFYSAWPVPFH